MLINHLFKALGFTRYVHITSMTILLALTCLLSACGLSDERGERTGETALGNDGAPEEDTTFAIKELIGIRVEALNGTINRVQTSQISIVTLDQDFNEISSRSVPAYRVKERLSGGYELQFEKSYVERVNQVIKVTFDQSAVPPVFLYAPLYKLGETQSISVNAKSHYVLKKLFDTISTPEQLAFLIQCESGDNNCANQPMAKANFLEQINLATKAFTISIPSTSTVAEAMSLLDARLDLKLSVETAVKEITRTRSPFTKATRRNFTLNAGDALSDLSIPRSYNSVFFGLSFSNLTPGDSDRAVNIAAATSTIIPTGQLNNAAPAYPHFNQTTTLFDMRRDILSSDIPFQRTILNIAQNSSFSINDTEVENSLTSNITDSFLSTQGFLLNERVVEQTIPGGPNDPKNIGWEFEPFFTRSYQVNNTEPTGENVDYGNAATWLTSSNYSKAASYLLTGTGSSLQRGAQQEDMHLFSWEVHGLETDETVSISTLNGKEYGVISYSLKFDDRENQNPLKIFSETSKWEINASNIAISQPSSHYQSVSLARADNNVTGGVLPETSLIETERNITTIETEGSSGSDFRGLVQLDGQTPPQGHTSQNGSFLAFAFNTKDRTDSQDRGQGIILATELAAFNYVFSGERFQLQGSSFEMTNEQNRLHQLNGSTLTINPPESSDPASVECRATLRVSRVTVNHTVGTLENTLSGPTQSTQTSVNSQSCTLDGSEILIEFPLVFGEPLSLRGFITQAKDADTVSPGNLINFIWQQSSQLGLIFANQEQALSPSFEE